MLANIVVLLVPGMVQDNFLLITDSKEGGLFQVDISAETAWKIPVSHQSNPITVAFDPTDSKIYWTDVEAKVIKRCNLNGTDEELVKSLHPSKLF